MNARLRTMTSILILSFAASTVGCAMGEFVPGDPMKRQFSLKKMQKRYSYLVRWSKFEEAVNFIEPKQRSAYLEWAPDIKDLRFTDYEIGEIEFDEEMRETTVDVMYTAYQMNQLYEYEIKETQHWTREGKGNNWLLRTSFVDFPEDEDETDGESDEDVADS